MYVYVNNTVPLKDNIAITSFLSIEYVVPYCVWIQVRTCPMLNGYNFQTYSIAAFEFAHATISYSIELNDRTQVSKWV